MLAAFRISSLASTFGSSFIAPYVMRVSHLCQGNRNIFSNNLPDMEVTEPARVGRLLMKLLARNPWFLVRGVGPTNTGHLLTIRRLPNETPGQPGEVSRHGRFTR